MFGVSGGVMGCGIGFLYSSLYGFIGRFVKHSSFAMFLTEGVT